MYFYIYFLYLKRLNCDVKWKNGELNVGVRKG